MIFSVPFKVINVANKLQISISDGTKTGQRMKREGLNEFVQDPSGNYLTHKHPEHDFLIKSNTNYFLFNGSLRIRYEWDADSVFQDEHVDTYLDLLKSKPAGLINPDKLTRGPGFVQNEVKSEFRSGTWGTSHLEYEPYCTIADVTILEDNTVILCPMQHVTGWTFEHINIMPGEKIVSNKVGEEMYIVFGQECFTYSKDGQWTRQVIEKHATKKQVSHELEINNGSGDMCTLVRIWK